MREFNEELHPRAPKGDENGGEFIKKDISDLNALNNDYDKNFNLWIEKLEKNKDIPLNYTKSSSIKEFGDSFYIKLYTKDWYDEVKIRFSGHSVFNYSRLTNEIHNPDIKDFKKIVEMVLTAKQKESLKIK